MTEKIEIYYNENQSSIRGLFETDHIYKVINTNKNFYELKVLKQIQSMNLSGTYVDVGANIGNHTIFFSKYCGSEKVISIEIDQNIFEVLEKNVNENNLENVKLINIGIGEEDKNVKISTINEVNVGMTHILDITGETKITTLDSILKDEKNISIIKIDVEGYEKNVILGAKKILKDHSPTIVVELETENRYLDFEKIVSRFGYKSNGKNYASTPTYIWKKEEKKYDFIYLIPSFERFDRAKKLVDQILSYNQNLLIIFLNDGSKDTKYELLKNYNDNLIYLENKSNNGKKGYWKTVNKLFSELSFYDYHHVLMLNDDFRFIDNFVNVIEEIKSETDIIRLFTPTTIPGKNWNFEYWIDGAFCAPKIFMEKLNYEIFPINKNNSISSGVGLQMTNRLNNLNFKVNNFGSLVYHEGNEDSVMHPDHRKKDPLVGIMYDNKKFDLSIIIPTFDNTEFISECLESLLNSSKNYNVEILIGIDGCEKTSSFFNENKFDQNVKILNFKKNEGPYIVKNTLSKICNSENILFFDSDDVAYPNLIPEIINNFKVYDLIKPMYHDFSGKLNQDDPQYKSKTKKWGEGVFAIKKNIFDTHNGFEGWRCAADSDFMGRMYKNNVKFVLTETPLFFRRIHDNSLTNHPDTNYSSSLRKSYFNESKNKTDFGPLKEMKISQNVDMEPIIPNEIIDQNLEVQNSLVSIIEQFIKPKITTNSLRKDLNEKREYINTFSRFTPPKKTKRK